MTRVIMQHYRDDDGHLHASWFDPDKAVATFTREDVQFPDQAYGIQGATATHGQRLCRTAADRWALEVGTTAPGGWQWIDADRARDMLITHFKAPDTEIARWLPEVEEERGPGRPRIGGEVLIRLGEELLGQVDAYASEHGLSRADAVRSGLREWLLAARSYTVTVLDLQTRVREIRSRHATLGAAVEALRDEEEYDAEDNSLPSRHPRVEHDGRPVDVEAVQS